jgi:hypothetical protein
MPVTPLPSVMMRTDLQEVWIATPELAREPLDALTSPYTPPRGSHRP